MKWINSCRQFIILMNCANTLAQHHQQIALEILEFILKWKRRIESCHSRQQSWGGLSPSAALLGVQVPVGYTVCPSGIYTPTLNNFCLDKKNVHMKNNRWLSLFKAHMKTWTLGFPLDDCNLAMINGIHLVSVGADWSMCSALEKNTSADWNLFKSTETNQPETCFCFLSAFLKNFASNGNKSGSSAADRIYF